MPMVVVSRGKGTLASIEGVRQRVERPEPGMVRVGKVVAQATRMNFATEGAYFGKKWQPLKPHYRAWKVSQGYPRQILVMSGEMRGTFANYPMNITEISGPRARFGSDNQKAKWHHHGTRRNGKRVNPPRPILYVNPVLRRLVKEEMASYILGKGD